jgi:hypothetical protein
LDKPEEKKALPEGPKKKELTAPKETKSKETTSGDDGS